MSEDRRADDERFIYIKESLKEIKETLTGNNGLCDRMAIVETKQESTQKELSEHKFNHIENTGNKFRRIDIYISAAMLILAVIVYFKK